MRAPFAAPVLAGTLCLALVGTARPLAAAGEITLKVDAREAPGKLIHAKLSIPVKPGPLTFVYPKWLPGEHGPTGPITDLVGLEFSSGGKTLVWSRDGVDMYAFHLDVPAGVASVDVALDFLSPTSESGFTSAASATPHLFLLTWNQLLLYPLGPKSDDLIFHASLLTPAGWKFGTSLSGTPGADGWTDFAPVSLTALVDSPVLMGEYFRAVPLDRSSRPVEIDLAADSAAALEISPELEKKLERLVVEADALFGARHFDNYHFLLTLSDHVAHFGLEHHQSNDSRISERALIDETLGNLSLGVLPHEFVHSWNGKYRRPTGLATPDFQVPMQGELLWVYEGLTEYLGNLLAARSGLWTPEHYQEEMAQIAATYDHRPGRAWRPLIDTTVAAQLLYGSPREWGSYRRGVDFYDEGWLLWLEVDTLIREKTHGARTLDDFCHLFHGGTSGSPKVVTYTFEDVISTLNAVAPYDWRGFWQERLRTPRAPTPLEGIERGGWNLAYTEKDNAILADQAKGERKSIEAAFSLGLWLNDEGEVRDAIRGLPAYQAGVRPGMKLIAINSRKWSPDLLHDGLAATKTATGPLDLLVEDGEMYRTYSIDYHGGLREPHLVRAEGKDDVLSKIIAPRGAEAPAK
ncbi:MAG: M61 family peptidase [Acidobacteriota bacterium]